MRSEYCYKTGKACLTESTAQALLDHDIYRSKAGHPRTYYPCPYCDTFHLTSQTGPRKYRRFQIRERIKAILTGD